MRWIWTYLRTSGDNFHEVVKGQLYRGATPEPKNLRKWKTKYNIRTWIDLRLPSDCDFGSPVPTDRTRLYNAQRVACKELGIEHIRIPISDREPTSDFDIERCLRLMSDSSNHSIFISCQGGRHRAGEMVALYCQRILGWGKDDVKETLSDGGFYDAKHERFARHLEKLLGFTLALLLLVTPAFGQGRFVLTDGSTQSEYGAPAADRNVICPVCSEAGKKSTVRRWLGYSNTLSFSPSFNERTEARFWDEDGRYHDHELAQELLVCSAGHRFYDFDDRRCWCEWPNGRYVIVESTPREGHVITLPPGTTWKDLLLNPAPAGTVTPYDLTYPVSYQQHPWIQPGPLLPLQDPALTRTDKESLTVQVVTPSTRQPDVSTESKKFDKSYWIPFSLAVGASLADYGTTAAGIKRGGREANPIFGGDDGRRVYYAANVAATAGFLGYTAWLEQKGHRTIARVLLYTLTALRVVASIHNYRIRR